MNIIIQTPGFTTTKKLEKFVRRKVEMLHGIDNRIEEARVCLKSDNSQTGEGKYCDIKLAVPGNDLFASDHCPTFEESFGSVIRALKRQIEQLKDSYGD